MPAPRPRPRNRRAKFFPQSSFRPEALEPRQLLSAGDLDSTFGGDGTVVTDMIGPVDTMAAEVSVAMADGRLVVAGRIRHAGGNDIALARYLPNGALDPSFGTGGRVVTDVNSGSFDEVADADVLPDGKVLVVGTTSRTGYQGFGDGADFMVARYNADGSLDRSFGGDGVVVTDLGRSISGPDGPLDAADVAAAVSLAPGGKVVVVGWTGYNGGADVAVVRYDADGSLDESFGGGAGIVTTNVYPESDDGDISASDDAAGDVYVHSDGRILIGGRARGEFLLVRYLSDGRIDPSFGRGRGPDYVPDPDPDEWGGGDPGDPGDGFVTTRFPGASAGITDLSVWRGKVVAAGTASHSYDGTGDDFAIARYDLAGGAVDRTFSTDGKLTIDFAGAADQASAVLVRGDGGVVVAGFATTSATLEDFAMARLDFRGRPVASFGNGGKVTTDFATAGGPTYDRAADATFTRDGKIVLAGPAAAIPGGDWGTSGTEFGLARYSSTGVLDRTFGPDGNGRVTTAFRGPLANHGADAVVQRDGKVVLAGIVNGNGGLHDIVLVRYNRDGSLDRTFGRGGADGDGVVTHDLSPGRDGRASDSVSGVALDRYGRIVVTGATDVRAPGVIDGGGARRWDVFVARFRPDGTPDSAFGGGAGFVVTDLGADDEYPAEVVLAPNGRIVVAAQTRAPGATWPALAVLRYLATGARDPSFGGGDGVVLTDLPGAIGERVGGAAVQGDGKILVAGQAWEENTGQNFALLRYNTDGALDPAFGGGDGWLTTDFGGSDAARAVTVMADGRIVAAGEGQASHGRRFSDFAVARYLPDGSPDPSFGAGTGRALLAPDNADLSWDAANDVLVQRDGKVVLVGVTVNFPRLTPGGGDPGRGDFAAVRFNADGSPDAGFGAGGLAKVNFGGFSVAAAGGIDLSGRLVLAGGVFAYDREARPTGSDFAVARLLLA